MVNSDALFTLKLHSEAQLRTLILGHEFDSKVIVEGSIGCIKKLEEFEGTLLKIEFEKGELYLDIDFRDLMRLLKKRNKVVEEKEET